MSEQITEQPVEHEEAGIRNLSDIGLLERIRFARISRRAQRLSDCPKTTDSSGNIIEVSSDDSNMHVHLTQAYGKAACIVNEVSLTWDETEASIQSYPYVVATRSFYQNDKVVGVAAYNTNDIPDKGSLHPVTIAYVLRQAKKVQSQT